MYLPKEVMETIERCTIKKMQSIEHRLKFLHEQHQSLMEQPGGLKGQLFHKTFSHIGEVYPQASKELKKRLRNEVLHEANHQAYVLLMKKNERTERINTSSKNAFA